MTFDSTHSPSSEAPRPRAHTLEHPLTRGQSPPVSGGPAAEEARLWTPRHFSYREKFKAAVLPPKALVLLHKQTSDPAAHLPGLLCLPTPVSLGSRSSKAVPSRPLSSPQLATRSSHRAPTTRNTLRGCGTEAKMLTLGLLAPHVPTQALSRPRGVTHTVSAQRAAPRVARPRL